MSNKLTWFVFMVLLACVWGLVAVSFVKSGTSYQFEDKNDSRASKGLKCVYNCDRFGELLILGSE